MCGACSNGITTRCSLRYQENSPSSTIETVELPAVEPSDVRISLVDSATKIPQVDVAGREGSIVGFLVAKVATKRKGFGVWTQHRGVLVCWVNLGVHRVHLSNKKQWKLIQFLKHGKCIYKPILFRGLVAPGVPWGCLI